MKTQRKKGGWQMDDPVSTVLLVFFIVTVFFIPWESCSGKQQTAPQGSSAAPAADAPQTDDGATE